jgi:hypothetical protein
LFAECDIIITVNEKNRNEFERGVHMLRMISEQEQERVTAMVKMIVGDAKRIYNLRDDCDYIVISSETEGNTLYSIDDIQDLLIEQMKKQFGTAQNYECNISVSKGLTKLVIVDSTREYAIKIPFTGSAYAINEDYTDYNFYPLNCNYCKEEQDIYNSLPDSVKPIFAETRYLLSVNDYIEVYIQEQVEEAFDESWKNDGSLTIDDLPEKEKAPMQSFRKKGYVWDLDQQFIYDILLRYGEMTVEELMDTIYDENINDLHNGNYGYTRDEEPKIFDYSGWRD